MRQLVCAAIAIAATCCCAAGALASSHSTALDLEQALDRAERASPLVRRVRAELELAAAGRVGAGVILPNPAIGLALGARRDRSGAVPPANGFEWALRVEQTIEIAGQRPARLREADAALRVAAARLRLAVVETRARTRAIYHGVLLARSAVESARRREELGRRLHDSAQARVRAGAASEVELQLALVERGRLESERIGAELAVADGLGELGELVGEALDESTRLTEPPPWSAELPERAELLARAERQRADLQALDQRRSELDLAIARLKREAVPSPTLFIDVAQEQPRQLYLGAGLALPLPLWQRNQGAIALARAAGNAVEVERRLLEREIALEVARAERTVRARQKESELWRTVVVPAADAHLELVEAGWRAGKFDLFRVIQAAREAGEARRTQLERQGALWQSLIELDRSTGTP